MRESTGGVRIRRMGRGLLAAVLMVSLGPAPALAQSSATPPQREQKMPRRTTEPKRAVKDGAPAPDRAPRNVERNRQATTGNNAPMAGRPRERTGPSSEQSAAVPVKPTKPTNIRPGRPEPTPSSEVQQSPAAPDAPSTNSPVQFSKKRALTRQ